MEMWMLISFAEGIVVGVMLWFMNKLNLQGLRRLAWYVFILTLMMFANALIMPIIGEDSLLIKAIIFGSGLILGMVGTGPVGRLLKKTNKWDVGESEDKAG